MSFYWHQRASRCPFKFQFNKFSEGKIPKKVSKSLLSLYVILSLPFLMAFAGGEDADQEPAQERGQRSDPLFNERGVSI